MQAMVTGNTGRRRSHRHDLVGWWFLLGHCYSADELFKRSVGAAAFSYRLRFRQIPREAFSICNYYITYEAVSTNRRDV